MIGTVNTFSKWLVEQREDRDWSQNKLAEKMQLSQAAVSRVEAGLIPPTAKFCKKLAEVFGLPLETVYQRANLLPTKSKYDELQEEANELFSKLKDKRTALNLLRVLPRENEDEEKQTNRSGSGNGHTVPR